MKEALGNPAIIAAALSTEAGQKAINKGVDATGKAVSLGFTILKVGIFFLAGYVVYKKVFPHFKKVKEDSRYHPANVTETGARQRAENLFTAMQGIGADFNKTSSNLKGLNHNGFIRVYNEFGERRGADFKKQNLTEWIYDQFSKSEITELKFITNNAF